MYLASCYILYIQFNIVNYNDLGWGLAAWPLKEKWYDYMRSKGIDTPYLRLSAKYWRIIRDFVEVYAAISKPRC